MNLLLGMRSGDGVDLLDDDLFEEFLDLGVGLLMLGLGYQAAGIEAMQQVIDGLPGKLTPNSPSRMRASHGSGRCRRYLGGGRSQGGLGTRHIARPGGAGVWCGALLESARCSGCSGDQANGAVRASQGAGDREGGVALLG